jgi:uracil-DNA glycosylase family 4
MANMHDDLKLLLTQAQKFLAQQEELYGESVYRHQTRPLTPPETPQHHPSKSVMAPPPPPRHESSPGVQEDLFGLSASMRLESPVLATNNSPAYPTEPWVAADSLERLNAQICTCTKCSLGHTRKNFVFGVGNPQAELVLVGEAPGAEEDEQGEPFVGRAGQLLNKILEAIHFRRQEVYICNILKCRPPNNRDPQPQEIELCEPYLWKQLELIKPKLILCLGRIAAQALLKTNASLSHLRGKVHNYRGIKLMVTYHPAALLRNPNWKKPAWDDVQLVRKVYDELTRANSA